MAGLRFEVRIECRKPTPDDKGYGDKVIEVTKTVEVLDVDQALYVATKVMSAADSCGTGLARAFTTLSDDISEFNPIKKKGRK